MGAQPVARGHLREVITPLFPLLIFQNKFQLDKLEIPASRVKKERAGITFYCIPPENSPPFFFFFLFKFFFFFIVLPILFLIKSRRGRQRLAWKAKKAHLKVGRNYFAGED